jgi:hypothetical protein
MEHYGAEINDKSLRLPVALQGILMDVYQILLAFHNGIPYLKCFPPTNEEVTSLPHVIMTSDIDWGPTTYYNDITDIITFYNAIIDTIHCSKFDDHGNCRIALWKLILYMQNLSFAMCISTVSTYM